MRWWLLMLMPAVAGCGPGIAVTKVDVPMAAQLDSTVRVIETSGMPLGARSLGGVEATSCKNKAWDASPTKENAILQMKSVAQKKGGNAIGNVYCEPPQGTNLGTNCWLSIRCTATAFVVGE